ncbi:carboxylesterase/lipase family protein [Microbulbifer sp. 2205BS26-8]|uniref:carboxylesterase/lipase family protein n=1 Tax=Microbulbifer sp. 2205BS26-8 TaxID=3064386 RepID=UPI00273DEA5F|nr:carboxylesterase family protein [Microbulbifer sp. 2205BS26-8]MDP5208334.1 carboxylesterase family protein [Microbulbifer sp. 2205BS26-8]
MARNPCLERKTHENPTPIVETPAGPMIGTIDQETGTYQFLGVPYAHPPVGKLRWLSPQPLPAWETPLHASAFGMPAAQNPSILMEVRGRNGAPPEREECLYLNIFSPPTSSNNRLPVMFWIHGGAFYMGSGCQEVYNGRYLAASGRAIIVTFNYRLGAFGFLRLKDICDIPSSGNEGLMDQIAALKWVNRNISAFGGDPQNITLFGESAGAMSIALLQKIPECQALFRRAIVQSGHPKAVHSISRANHLAETFVKHLDSIGNGKPPRDCTPKMLLQTQTKILTDCRMTQCWGQLPFKPVIDHELLKETSVTGHTESTPAVKPLLLGNNLEEWNLFSVTNSEIYTLDYHKICNHLGWLLPEKKIKPLLGHYYQLALSIQDSPWPQWSQAWNLLLTDMVFTLPGLRHLTNHQGEGFHYHFTQPLAAQPLLGACHAVELGYVFGTHGEQSLHALYGAETGAHLLSASMQEAWLSFAETGCPGEGWPIFSGKHSKRFGNHPTARTFNTSELLALWQDIPDKILYGYL